MTSAEPSLRSDRTRSCILGASIFIGACIALYTDLHIELGVAVGVLYIPVMGLAALWGDVRRIWVIGGLCATLTVVGWMYSPGNVATLVVLTNRALSMIAIAATTILASRYDFVKKCRRQIDADLAALQREQGELRAQTEDSVRRMQALASITQDLAIERTRLHEEIAIRQHAEQENERLVTLIESSDDAIMGLTLDGRITSWNSGAERLYGHRRDAIRGQTVRIIEPSGPSVVLPMLERLKQRASVRGVETKHRGADGRSLDISLKISSIPNEDGGVIGASVIARDISERKRSDRLAHLAVEASSSGMIMIDRNGNIVVVNTKIEEIFGYSRDEMLGEHVNMLLPPRLRDRHAAQILGFFEKPETRPMGAGRDLLGQTRDGRRVLVEIALTPVETENGPHVLAAVADITERENTYAELRTKTREMEQLLYVVSHDLKSPLVTVNGFAGILTKHLESQNYDRAKDAAARIVRGAAMMDRLIDDLLQLSRTSSHEIQISAVTTSEVVDAAVEALGASFAAAQATAEVSPSLPTIHADPDQLMRVLLNLISNALKYGCSKPQSVVRIFGEDHPDFVRLCVADDGCGIDPKFHHKVFQLFQRLASDDEGTGLGLATVAKIMERHDGKAWIESKLDEGAALWLEFPKRPEITATSPNEFAGAIA